MRCSKGAQVGPSVRCSKGAEVGRHVVGAEDGPRLSGGLAYPDGAVLGAAVLDVQVLGAIVLGAAVLHQHTVHSIQPFTRERP